MKGGLKSSGFTIIEEMIVLAVTGLILLIAIAIIEGRTGQSEFLSAIHGMQTQLTQIASQAQDGNYSLSTSICGASSMCTVLGKAISLPTGTSTTYNVYPIIGTECTTDAVCAAPQSLSGYTPAVNTQLAYVTNLSISYGLQPVGITAYPGAITNDNGARISAFAFAANPSALTSSSGVVPTALYLVSGYPPGGSPSYQVDTSTGVISGVSICFNSDTSNQSGLISIGSETASDSASPLAVNLVIYYKIGC